MELTLRFIAFCLVSSLLSHSSFGTTTDKEFSTADSLYIDLMGKADTAIAQNDWSQAESLLLTAMRSQPSNPANVLLLSNLAIIRFQQGNDSLALATINDAIIIAPNSVTALNNRARILKAIGDIDGAYADYEKIFTLDSTLTEPLYLHGIIALSKFDTQTAFNDFSKLEQIIPNDIMTLDAMAMYYFHTQEFKMAIPYFNKLLAIDKNADYYHDKIVCLLFENQYSDASADINDAISLYPNNGNFYLLRAYLNRMYYRQNDADNDAKKALELGVPAEKVKMWMEITPFNSKNK